MELDAERRVRATQRAFEASRGHAREAPHTLFMHRCTLGYGNVSDVNGGWSRRSQRTVQKCSTKASTGGDGRNRASRTRPSARSRFKSRAVDRLECGPWRAVSRFYNIALLLYGYNLGNVHTRDQHV